MAKTKAIRWTDDKTAEIKLKDLGAEYTTIQRVHVNEIDRTSSWKNNARVYEPRKESLISEYGEAMLAGDAFPMIILVKLRNAKYYVISGNHRLAAAAEHVGALTIPAYVLTKNNKQINDLLARCANRWQGDRQAKEETVQHAKHLMHAYNLKVSEVSATFSVSANWLEKELRADAMIERAYGWGIDLSNTSSTALNKLNILRTSKPVLKRACELTQDYDLTVEKVHQVVHAIKDLPSERDQLKRIAGFEQKFSQETGVVAKKAPKNPNRRKLYNCVNSLHTHLFAGNKGKEFATLSQLQITEEEDAKAFKRTWREAKRKLDSILYPKG